MTEDETVMTNVIRKFVECLMHDGHGHIILAIPINATDINEIKCMSNYDVDFINGCDVDGYVTLCSEHISDVTFNEMSDNEFDREIPYQISKFTTEAQDNFNEMIKSRK